MDHRSQEDDMLSHILSAPCHTNQSLTNIITTTRRRKVSSFILELSDAFKCAPSAFAAAMMYCDRYLLQQPRFSQDSLSLLAGASLMIASKIVGTAALHPESLAHCLNNRYTIPQLFHMERSIANILDWQLNPALPHEAINLLLQKLSAVLGPEQMETIRANAFTFIDMFYFEPLVCVVPPGAIAMACLQCAVFGVADSKPAPLFSEQAEKIRFLMASTLPDCQKESFKFALERLPHIYRMHRDDQALEDEGIASGQSSPTVTEQCFSHV